MLVLFYVFVGVSVLKYKNRDIKVPVQSLRIHKLAMYRLIAVLLPGALRRCLRLLWGHHLQLLGDDGQLDEVVGQLVRQHLDAVPVHQKLVRVRVDVGLLVRGQPPELREFHAHLVVLQTEVFAASVEVLARCGDLRRDEFGGLESWSCVVELC